MLTIHTCGSAAARSLALGLVGLGVVGVCASKRAAATCASVRLCIAIDGSGSIGNSDFDLIKSGLANAISDSSIVPQDGSIELSFVQFGTSVATHVSPIVIDSQTTANSVASVLNSIPKDDGGTNMSLAISTCSSLITGSCGSSRQVINVVTDGTPDSQSNTIAARNAAIGAGIDEINAEAVSAPAGAFTFLRDQLVHPQPGIEAPPFTSPGFVIRTDTFADFAQAVRGKIGSIVGPQECFIDPPAATNPLGATHFFNVSVTNTDGTPAVAASVHVEVISGPNTGVSGNFTTDANGELTGLNYADNNGGGRDTIEVSGTSGGTPFSCTATKFWGNPPPPCTVQPATDTNPVNTDHTVTATFTTADGLPPVGVLVSVSISSGPNQLFADAVTNANGQVPLTYTGGRTPGTDIIEFAAVIDGEIARCSARKTWVIVPPTCDIQPPAAVNLTGTQHSMTVSVNHSDGTPAAGAHFNFEIVSGPNAGASSSGSTGAGGSALASYTGTGGAGTDSIEVSGTLDGQPFSCTASKTWEAPPPPCTVNPPSATNLVGSQHTVTATFKRGDGSFASGVQVSINTSGANPQPQQSRTTNAGGLVSWTYTGTHDGLDTIQFSGDVDGHPVSCGATKTWELPPPPCTVNPPSATNLVGSQHTVTATFKRGDGSLATGVDVAISTSGANSRVFPDHVTNAGGQVSLTYTGANAGTDTIHFSGNVDGHAVSCSASKTWELPPPPCLVDPPSGTNAVGSEHTVTATFKRGDGSAAVGVDVAISISGPNAPSAGQRTTDADGKVHWSYTGQNTGTDTIDFSGTVDGHEVTCSATKTWEIPPPPCSVSPASATNPIGYEHVVTATFRRADGSPAAGVDVSITTSGVNPLASASDVTGAGGQVTWSYTGEVAGTDTTVFTGRVDGHEVTCSATKTWVVPQPACNAVPASAVNRVGTKHTVTATFTRADGSSAVGVPVSITISGVSPTVFVDAETAAGGRVAPPPYTSETVGDDLIEFAGVVDGQVVSCSATKTWVVSQPTCEATPATAVNPVGTEHVVTAIFRKANGSPAAGVEVAISTSGVNPAAFGHGITTAGGQVAFPYTGENTGTDAIEFGGLVDGQLVRCSASKTWVPARPSCHVFPGTAVNRVGATHVVGAAFRRGDGSPASGAEVAISISGASGTTLVDSMADAGGLVTWAYKGLDPGNDVIEFSAVVEGQRVACQATKTWVGAQPTCSLVPTTAVNPVGAQHTVTAVFTRADGSPAAGVPAAISISGVSGTTLADGMTDPSGRVPWSYRGPKPGTDVIEFTAFVDDRVVGCRATKTWVAGQPTCEAVPATAVNPVGSRHTVAAIFRRGDGSPAAGVRVAIGVAGSPVPDFDPGPNPGGLGLIPFIFRSGITDGRGALEFLYRSDRPGTDTIEFSGLVDGRLVTCRAAKTWVGGQPTCELTPATAVNRVGTQHVVTGTFKRGDGSPAASVGVAISTSGASPAVLVDSFADANGQVAWPYSGPNPGTDIIEMRAFVDGQVVVCRATKTWIPAQPTCDVVPVRAVNPVGSQHTVTATFRRSDGSVAAGVPVAFSVSGASPMLLGNGLTTAAGQVELPPYDGPNPGVDFIDFTAFFEGRTVSCRAVKTWVAGQPTCNAVPGTAVNVVGGTHAVSATFRRGDGAPAAGVNVTARIVSGPNAGLDISGVTDAAGLAAPPPYTGRPQGGTDVIEFRGTVDGQVVTCNATKTWVTRQGSCRIFPSSDVNPTGTQHAVSGTFRRADGTPAVGVNVTMQVASGPNAGLITNGVTDAGGLVAPPPYTGGPQGGTDVVEFRGTLDGQVVTCNATKTWVAARPTCDAAPSGVVNPVGSRHTVTAVFRRGNGAPAAGVSVAVATTGPNQNLVNMTADVNGWVSRTYTGSANPGTDVIDFSAVVDGQPVTCRATKIWTAARPSCTASPVTAVNPVGTRHTATAVFRRGNGAPAAGVPVTIRVAGPNPSQVNDMTSAGGQVARTYPGRATGTDAIDFSAVVDGQPVSCRVLKTWTAAQAACTVSPASMTNPAGTRHAVTATFRRGDGSLAAGVPVSIRVSGVSPLRQGNDTTNAVGEVQFSYVGGLQPGADVIEFSGVVDGQVVTCRGSKTWTAAQPRCEALPAAAVKRVATFHAVTAIFRRGDGSPVPALPVTIDITSGPNAALPRRDKLTNGSGEARLGYIGTAPGADVIEFSGVVDGQVVRCQADTTWTVAQPACDAVPATATKAAGSTHTVTASFTRADGSPAPGVKVTVGIASGPDSPLSASNATDGAGEVPFTYTSGSQAGTDVIEFSGFVGGQAVRCSASMTVAAVGRATCDAVPATAPDNGSREHTVTATFRRGDGSPAAAVNVAVRVTNASMVPILDNLVTGAGGQAPFTYASGALAGTDTIEFTGVVDGETVSCSATKTWDGAKPSCDADPPKDVNPLGTLHVVTVTFKRSDGSPATGVDVAMGISSGPNSALLNTKKTDAGGEAAFSYLGSAKGTDVIEFSGVVEGQTVRCTAAKTWGTTPPGCDAVPTSSVSPLGMEHSVTAIFRRADGSPAAGVDVKADITAGPTSSLTRDLTTNANGQARLTYSGSADGTDVIEFSSTVDGQAVTCRANQTWAGGVAPTPTATVTPTAAPTVTGTFPTATATATPTPLADCSCVGDCDCGGEVTVDEIVTMVNIALGVRGGEACPAGDANGLPGVTVDEIILAVNNALFGCSLQAPARG